MTGEEKMVEDLFQELRGQHREVKRWLLMTRRFLADLRFPETSAGKKRSSFRDGAGAVFDQELVSKENCLGIFGSALTNFGVETFLQHFLKMTIPASKDVGRRPIDPMEEPDFSALSLKDPGKYEQGAPGPDRIYADLLRRSLKPAWAVAAYAGR